MSDQELTGAVGAQEDEPTGSQPTSQPGQGGASGINWETDPAFREWKSKRDRELNQVRRELEERQRELERIAREKAQAEARAEQMKHYVAQYNPDAYQEWERDMRMVELQQELEYYRQKEQERAAAEQAREYHVQMALSLGLDPDDPRYVRALNSGDNATIERIRAEMFVEKQNMSEKREPQSAPPPHDNVVLPSGGAAPAEVDTLMAQYEQEKAKLRPGDVAGLVNLKIKYRKKGLDIPLW